MTTPEYLAKLEAALTKDDWQYIEYAVAQRFAAAKPKKDELGLKPSTAFKAQETRIMSFLNRKAFG